MFQVSQPVIMMMTVITRTAVVGDIYVVVLSQR